MAPTKPGRYVYRPESLVQLRKELGLTQTRMAEALGVPANTLSRWENGATTPDAESLAAIYSVAMEQNIQPNFFRRRRPMPKPSTDRSRLVVMLDLQNIRALGSDSPPANPLFQDFLRPVGAVEAMSFDRVRYIDSAIRRALDSRFAHAAYRLYKAFAGLHGDGTADELEKLGWRIWEYRDDLGDEMASQARSDCSQTPHDTTLVLITKDRDCSELVYDLQQWGVAVYLFTTHHRYNENLVRAVGEKRWIQLPYPEPSVI